MGSTKHWVIGTLVLLVVFTAGAGISYSALKSGFGKVIKIAYMNGYVDAVRLDLERIKELKGNADVLRDIVQASSEEYLKKVSKLNQESF